MAALKIPSLSKEYAKVPVTGPVDLAALTVQMAVVASGQEPTGPDWQAAAWIGSSAAVMVGPGSTLVLAKGNYGIWVKITSSPEIPVLGPYPLTIT